MSERRRRREIAAGITAALAVALILGLLWFTRMIVLLTILGAIFGVALGRGAAFLAPLRIPRSLAAVLIMATLLGGAAALTWAVAPALAARLRDVGHDVPAALDRLEEAIGHRSIAGVPLPTVDLHAPRLLRSIFTSQSAALTQMLFPFLANAVTALAGVIVVLFIALYVAAEPGLLPRGGPTPRSARATSVRRCAPRADRRHRYALAGGAPSGAMVAVGAVSGLAFWAIDLPAAAALGIIAGLLEFIPFFGPIASAVPAIAVGFLVSPVKALYVIVICIVIQQLEGNVITPLIMRSRIACLRS
ncbi:MAG: AI-2E family transporter [Acidobacteriota bacterium]|nr:AI-2E family transporter [Acidobacteriota bacterium]